MVLPSLQMHDLTTLSMGMTLSEIRRSSILVALLMGFAEEVWYPMSPAGTLGPQTTAGK
jgi:hypothetical protein